MRTPANPQKAGIHARELLTRLSGFFAPLKILSFVFVISLIFVAMPAYSAVITKTFIDRKTGVAGAGMATAGQMAKYVADGSTGEMKMQGVDVATVAISGAYADLTGAPGALSVADILTGTDTTGKLVSAQTANAAMGGYTTTTGTASAYSATIPGFVLQDGARVRLQMHAENIANATLDVNTTGAKNIQVTSGMNISAYYFPVNGTADFVYKSSIDKWMVVGSSVIQSAPDDIRRSAIESYRRYSGDTLRRGILSYGGAIVTTAGTAAAYTISDSTNYPTNITYLNAGTKVVAKMNVANADNATLRFNGMTAAPIYYKGSAITAGVLEQNGVYTLVYDGTYWNVVMSPISVSNIISALGSLSVADILTGTDTTNKLISAQTINAAMGGYVTTSGTGSAYIASIPGLTALQNGARIRLKMHAANGASPTLNVNSLGAKNIQTAAGVNMPASYLIQDGTADFVYDGTAWIVVGSSINTGTSDNIRLANTDNYNRFSGATLKAGILNFAGAAVSTSGTSSAYIITDTTNYSTVAATGTKIVAKMHVANSAGATLTLNAWSAAIYYKGAAVTAGLLEADGTYTLVFDGAHWNVVMSPMPVSNIISALGVLTVPDILTGTDTTGKLISAETLNSAMGGYITTTGGSSAYIAAIPGISALQDGMRIRLKMHMLNSATAMLNVNNLGAKYIHTYSGGYIPYGYFITNSVMDFVYDAAALSGVGAWIIVGSGMLQGTADNIRSSNAYNFHRFAGSELKKAMLSYGGSVVSTTGTGAAYSISDSTNYTTTISSYLTTGTKVVAKMNVANLANATLSLNSLAAKPIYYKDAAVTAGLLELNGVYTFVYEGTSATDASGKWHVVMSPGSGSSAGALTVSEILTGTATTDKLVSAQNFNAAAGGYATTTTCSGGSVGVDYCAAIPGFILQDGARVRLRMHVANNNSPKLNVNSLGAKNMFQYFGMEIGYFPQDSVADFVYDGALDQWRIVGSSMMPADAGIIWSASSDMGYRYSGETLKTAILGLAGAVATTSGTSSAYLVSNANYPTALAYLVVGLKIVVKMHVTNAASAALSLNAMNGANIYFNGAAIAAGMLQANGIYTFVYDGTNWNVVQSPGVIPITPAQCSDMNARCLLAYGDTDLITAGIQGPGYIWEVVDR